MLACSPPALLSSCSEHLPGFSLQCFIHVESSTALPFGQGIRVVACQCCHRRLALPCSLAVLAPACPCLPLLAHACPCLSSCHWLTVQASTHSHRSHCEATSNQMTSDRVRPPSLIEPNCRSGGATACSHEPCTTSTRLSTLLSPPSMDDSVGRDPQLPYRHAAALSPLYCTMHQHLTANIILDRRGRTFLTVGSSVMI